MRAVIINVGNEVLTGKVINTNGTFLSIELNKIGINVLKIITVGDDLEMLTNEIKSFLSSPYEILITTGGLGPTHDDFTKEVLFDTIGVPLVKHQEPLDLLNKYFQGNFEKCNLKQTLYPENAYLLPNDKGTAMGAITEWNNKSYCILVGPPFEMEPMVRDYVIPYYQKKSTVKRISKEYILMGAGESVIEEKLLPLLIKYPTVFIAPYASIGKIRYLLSIDNVDDNKEKIFQDAVKEFEFLLDEYIITSCNETIEEKVYQELIRLNYHISFSESCTGGLLAAKMVNISGASNVFKQSFVTYSNESKINLLHVNKETIAKYDVVSEEVAKEMAVGIQKASECEVAVSVTGYAGPLGGTETIPTGTVCYAIVINDKVFTFTNYFRTDRNILRDKATMIIYYNLYRLLKNTKK